ncbi:glycosyltransferase family 4 protein [Massilia violaceinigra]|uniref:Glycosyltransferase family 4 protein n=1 Tax=Massilia violaceinigra TaxID=2045208 RepID=A0ABY4ACK4_9BURK|nr:glycosyltransferase family 4 protein [Massilia violaceinigra]UOD32122.1 glycosyltransferase family 4 protein [Massilia violaceinigra]
MKISVIHGICVRNDAISNAIADNIGWLIEAGHEVVLFTYACEHAVPHRLVRDVTDIMTDAHFQASDAVIFHFGIYYPLFDLILLVPERARRLVVFHNITPKQFVGAEHHATIDKSFAQMANMMFADHVACDSASNLAVLRAARVSTPASVLPLAVHGQAQPCAAKPGHADGIVRLLFIGRLVRSKGVADLLDAVERCLQADSGVRIALDLVANLGFSDAALVGAVRAAADEWPRRYGPRVSLRLHGDAPDQLKQRLLAEADVFVLPTYHEGFCVPIVEALSAGCRVVCYDNSNTPAIAGGLARLVPTADIALLAQAIGAELALARAPAWRQDGFASFAGQAWRYAHSFAPARARHRLSAWVLDAVNGVLDH